MFVFGNFKETSSVERVLFFNLWFIVLFALDICLLFEFILFTFVLFCLVAVLEVE